jgi:hypothetical protein
MTDKLQSILQAEGLDHLIPKLVEQGVVDSMLPDLSESDLRSLGVDKLGERKRLLAALTAMRDANEGGGRKQSGSGNNVDDTSKEKSLDIVKSDATKPVATKSTEEKKAKPQPAGEKSLKKSEVPVVQTSSESATPAAGKPMNRIWLVIGIFVMGPLPLFFVSWKRALLSILLIIITLGMPIAPALKFWLFWVGIPLLLVFTKKRS